MAAYLDFIHAKPRITTSTLDLAQEYLDEGAKTGVRGDVAFAQSILETGGFANPGSAATDNNFAGIGWCDSCAHGFDFPTAQLGVRAQLQLLRIYVDPNFPDASYKDPILLKGTLSLGFRGKVQTWWDLWGTWATGALYGQRVYDIYEKMVDLREGGAAVATQGTGTRDPRGEFAVDDDWPAGQLRPRNQDPVTGRRARAYGGTSLFPRHALVIRDRSSVTDREPRRSAAPAGTRGQHLDPLGLGDGLARADAVDRRRHVGLLRLGRRLGRLIHRVGFRRCVAGLGDVTGLRLSKDGDRRVGIHLVR